MKKRVFCIFAAALLILSVSGCSKGGQAPASDPPASSSEPAPEPVPESEPEPEPPAAGLVPEGARAEDAYFDDAVFIGDSATAKLQSTVEAKRGAGTGALGQAQFLTDGLLGCANTLREVGSKDSIHPKYEGEAIPLDEAVSKIGAKKVYIMLGHNDVALYGNENTVANMKTLLAKIKEKSSEALIFVQGVTPLVAGKDNNSFSNENFKAYNELLSALCTSEGYYYLDAASSLQDEAGALKPEFCSDPEQAGFHLSEKGCEAWLEYLYTHTV